MARKPASRPALGVLALCGLALGGWAAAVGARSTDEAAGPPLVVALVIDQFRLDLLDRYDGLYEGGLRRLLDGGFRFAAVHDHAVTETAAGHATLSTGVFPSRHGIPGNDWRERVGDRWRLVYAVSDSTAPILDHPDQPGRSPANLRRDGLADWIAASSSASRIVSISRKDRSAITMAGHTRGDVYWILPSAGRFVTSRHYADALPEWVVTFNRDSMPRFYSDSVWSSELGQEAAAWARTDSAAYEMDGVHVAFPHRFGELDGTSDESNYEKWVTEHTPFPDAALLSFARVAIREKQMGRDAVPDFLSISLSQTDAIGHDYGPGSVEQLDNLIRLDRELGRFFDFLDAEVGAGGWVLALSADHGVMTEPEEMQAEGLPGRRITGQDLVAAFEAARSAAAAGPEAGSPQRVDSALKAMPLIADVWTFGELADRVAAADSFMTFFRNSQVPGRPTGSFYRFGVEVLLAEGVIADRFGSTHGSAWLYDRQVPLIFYGPGISAGWSAERARTVDFAPTLAALAGIPVPSDLDGRDLAPLISR